MTLALVRDQKPRATCGDHGGRSRDGTPCRRPRGWGLPMPDGPCRHHVHIAAEQDAHPPPKHLAADSAAIWRELTGTYVFGVEGFPILEAALEARDRAREARRELERTGLLFVSESSTPHLNPLAKVERDAMREFRLAWKQLNLDVSAPEADQ